MLNSMRKRESNYCRETIRELLSKTRCLSKLMDQQATAVSFPIPFSCTSVLSNHLTLVMQAGSLQLARPRLPCSFTGATRSNYICAARDGSLIVCDAEISVQGKCTVVLTSNRSSRFYPVWAREATPREEQLVSYYPSLVGTHHAYEQKIKRVFTETYCFEILGLRFSKVLISTSIHSPEARVCYPNLKAKKELD